MNVDSPRSPHIWALPWAIAGWALLCAGVGVLLGTGGWVAAAAVLGALALARLVLAGAWPMAVVWLVLVPTVGVFLDNLLGGLPFVRSKRIAFLILMGLWAWSATLQPRRVPLVPLERRMLWFLALALLSLLTALGSKPLALWAKDDASFLFDGYLMPMMAFFIARRIDWPEPRFQQLLWLLMAAAALLALTAPLETLLGITWFVPSYMLVIQTIERATGTFGTAAEFGVVMGAFFLLAAYLRLHARTTPMKTLCTLLMLLLLSAVVLSKTRAAWLGLTLALSYLYVTEPRCRPLLKTFALLGALALVAAVPFLLALRGFEERVTELSPIYNRLAGWTTALNMMINNPLTGIGFGRAAFGDVRGDYATGFGDVSGSWIREMVVPHNEFFNIAAMMGIFGIAVYLAVIGGMFRRLRTAAADLTRGDSTRIFAGHVAAIWLLWIVNACFADFGNLHYINVLVFFLSGLAVWHIDNDGRAAVGG